MTGLFIAFATGVFFGVGVTFISYKFVSRRNEHDFNAAIDIASEKLKAGFGEISQKTMSNTADYMIKIASEKLTAERELSSKDLVGQRNLIEARVTALNGELDKLTSLIGTLEKSRNVEMGQLKSAISESHARTLDLAKVTGGLKEVLSSKQCRGQWAERMAGDILEFAGLKEGINYKRQAVSQSTGNRPDFTFFLPNGLKLNMDVKFPFENYQRLVEAATAEQKEIFRKDFLKDVKNHIKAISGREYIDPSENTADCVLMFIPNEGVYGQIFESDITVLEEAAKRNVLVCSPVTILSVLAIIRQAADNFVVATKAKEIIAGIAIFRKEWLKYSEGFEKIGNHIEKLSKDYNDLRSVRSSKLENSMIKLEALDVDIKE